MDLKLEKRYIEEIDKKVRNLELEKVKLEQQKIYTEKAIDETLAKMQELGFTPDTIDDGISTMESNILALKTKINTILAIEEEVEKDESYPF